MKGLLHRLAARADGTALVVRSDAALPYVASRFAWRDATEPAMRSRDDAAVRPDAGRAPTTPAGRTTEAAAGPAGEPAEPGPRADAAAAAPPGRLVAQRSPGPQAPALLSTQVARAASVASEDGPEPVAALHPSRASSAPSSIAARAEQAPTPAPAAARPDPPTLLERVRLVPALRLAHAPADADALRTAPTDGVPTLPPRTLEFAASELTPRGFDPARASAARADRRSPEPAAASADEPNEVHVHIGRIEITAVHEAPKTRGSRMKKPSAMSLDSYLAARSVR